MITPSAFSLAPGNFPCANVIEADTLVLKPTSDRFSRSTGLAVWVTKVFTAHYRREDLLLRASQINDPENLFRNISDAHVLPLVHSFYAYEFVHAWGTISITATATASRSKKSEGALSATPRGLDEAVSAVLLKASASSVA